MKAIVYKSQTGSSKRYAELISKELSIPAYSLKESNNHLSNGDDIIYVGWLSAGTIKGYKKAKKIYNIKNIVAVGMTASRQQEESLYKTNKINKDVYVLNVKGNLYLDKLHFPYNIMMKTMKKFVTKGLKDKKELTPQDQEILDSINNVKDEVNKEYLTSLFEHLMK